MIILNGKKFAKNEKQAIESLFENDGTFVGYYKVFKKSIGLYDLQKNKIGVIANNVLGSCTKQNRKYWYSYATIKQVGEYKSFLQYSNEIQSICKKFEI